VNFGRHSPLSLWTFVLAVIILGMAAVKALVLAQGHHNSADAAVARTVGKTAKAAASVAGAVASAPSIFRFRSIARENEELRQENQKLMTENLRLRNLLAERDRLRNLLHVRAVGKGVKMTAASVIGRNFDFWFDAVLIDRGSSDGVRNKSLVISDSGVVGRVMEVKPHQSWVQLAVNSDFAVGVVSAVSRSQGVVVGRDVSSMEMEYVPSTTQLKVGEDLFTSGVSPDSPAGYLVGEVSKIVSERGKFTLQVSVRPAANFAALSEVLVLT
jgi:rod shape-determining protein MreC